MCFVLFLVLLLALGATVALADETDLDLDYPWRGHAAPFDHMFGNMIDGHQQSLILKKGQLSGFIYVEYTAEMTEDGLPVAKKATCASGNRTVGWVVKGVPISAKLVNQSPRIWLVDPDDLPQEKGYTHFHWTGAPQKPHDLEVGEVYDDGYLMKRVAPASFFWLGGGQSQSGGGSGGCTGDEGGCGDEAGGCGDDTGGCTGEDGGCGDETGGCTGDEGGCGGEEGGCTGDEGGCGDETGGCTGDEGGCSGGGGSGGSSHGGHSGRVVPEGVDLHANIVTTWDGTRSGCGGCSAGCGDH